MRKESITSQILILSFLFVAFMNIINVLIGFRALFQGHYSYSDMLISEWLINYAGGFVRRGLTGQLLLSLYNLYPHPIIFTIIFIYFGGLIILITIVSIVFKKEKWSPYIIIYPICISMSFLGTRRDYLALILSFGCFMFCNLYNKKKELTHLFLVNFICIINILIHEASFFFMIPILFIYNIIINKKHPSNKRLLLSFISLLPSIFSFIIVCIYKGDPLTSASIWDSWASCFHNYPMGDSAPPLGSAVEWLTYDTAYAFNLHIHRFWNSSFIYNLPSWPFNVYTIMATYYLLLFMNTIKIGIWEISSFNRITLGNILFLQFIFLFPMFGFLSCDFGRVIMYWTISSLFSYHWFKNSFYNIPFVTSITIKIITLLDRTPWLSRKLCYYIILISIPIAGSQGSNILSCFAFIPYGWRLTIWEHILDTLPIIE